MTQNERVEREREDADVGEDAKRTEFGVGDE